MDGNKYRSSLLPLKRNVESVKCQYRVCTQLSGSINVCVKLEMNIQRLFLLHGGRFHHGFASHISLLDVVHVFG